MLFLLCQISSLNTKLTNVDEENGRMIFTCLKYTVFTNRILKIDGLMWCNSRQWPSWRFFFGTIFGTKTSTVIHLIFIQNYYTQSIILGHGREKLQDSSHQQIRLLCINFILQYLCESSGQIILILHEETGE